MDIKISDKILPHFHDLWKAADDESILHVVANGGRNSSKSTTIAIRLVFNRMIYKSHALVIRKVDKTLRKSCRNQLIWAIKYLGCEEYWHWSAAPNGDMALVYKPTGASIYFEGANNPDNLKSWKTEDFETTNIWYEEVADFKTEEEISVINNSILRAELLDKELSYKFFYSYNPPKRKQSWLNKKFDSVTVPANTFVHHSNYLNNKYCSKEFIEEAEHIKATNQQRYKWEYLGEPTGSGVVPFNNLVFRTITDSEISTFDNIRQGNDWGYAVDPNAFVRWHYDKTRNIIYAMNEVYEVKLSNRSLADKISMFVDIKTVADSAEPKSIAEMNSYGCNFIPSIKGPGSVEYGEKWLDDLEAIVIDPNRTPNIAREFENIDYQVDKDGNPLSRLEDKDNHGIDSTRYSLQDDMTYGNEWGKW